MSATAVGLSCSILADKADNDEQEKQMEQEMQQEKEKHDDIIGL